MQDYEENKEVAEFQIGDMLGIGITFIILVIAIAFGLDLVEDTKEDMTVNGYAYNATIDGEKAISKFTGKLGMIAGAVVVAIVIGVLVRYLYNAGQTR